MEDSNSNSDYSSDDDFEKLQPLEIEGRLPFDPCSLEKIILGIGDRFNFKIVFNNKHARRAMCMGTGLAIAGGLIGRHYAGKVGAMVGSAVGGVCGVGIVILTLRDAWPEIRAQLSELFDVVYDYLANLNMEDYRQAAIFLATHAGDQSQLAKLVMQVMSSTLGKQVLSSLTN